MPDTSTFELWDTPRPLSIKNTGKQGLTVLFGGGIVNPFGPTLNLLATDGLFDESAGKGGTLQILHIVLNPFTQECQTVGHVTVGESWHPFADLTPFFDFIFGSCPTLLLPPGYFEPDEGISFYARFLARFSDGKDVLNLVREYPGDPWSRVSKQMAEIPSSLKRSSQESSVALTEDEATELATALLQPENVTAELQAFLYAWKGSIDYQRKEGSSGFADTAMQLNDFLHLLAVISYSCPGLVNLSAQ